MTKKTIEDAFEKIKDRIKKFFVDYKKENEDLIKKWTKEVNEDNDTIKSLKNEALKAANEYNSKVAAINAECSSLLKSDGIITTLYDFLKYCGNIGKEITPCDFNCEIFIWPQVENFEMSDNPQVEHKVPNENIYDKTDKLITDVFITFVCPPVGVIEKIKDHKTQEAYYEENVKKYEEDRIKRQKQIEKATAEKNFFEDANKISKLYYVTIKNVDGVIEKTIWPELYEILAFLYADAIKECIKEGEDPTKPEPFNISLYKDTHPEYFTFVKNAYDYYELVVGFFTNEILTKIFEDHEITSDEWGQFMQEIEKVKKGTNVISRTDSQR